jgi:GT2 family glycosyltransferase
MLLVFLLQSLFMNGPAEMKKIKLDASISIGISAYGNVEATRHCIECLFGAVEGDFELILVDDCSPDDGEILDLFLEVSTIHKNTLVFRFDTNLEYSGSLNCILSHATGEKVIFLSNDIYINPNYVSEMLSVSDKNQHIGIVRGVSNFVDNGKPSHNIACNEFKTHEDMLGFSSRRKGSHFGSFFYEEYLTGDAFLVNRRLLEKIGTFDPLFFGYFADHDFGVRAHIAGFRLAVAEGAFAFHHCAANFDYLDEAKRKIKLEARWHKIIENWARFKIKYKMPVNVLYTSINDIEWSKLNAARIDPYIEPANYLDYRILR